MEFEQHRPMDDDRRVIVIGSGPSGAVAALALLQRGIPVTLLESGQRAPRGLLVRAMGRNILRKRPSFGAPRPYVATGDPTTRWFRELALGGLSNHWTGIVPRFAPQDFCEGARLHERYRWPVSYEELAPYYERIERLLVVVGSPRDVINLPAGHVAHRRALPGPWQEVARAAAAFGQGLTPAPLADGAPWLLRSTGTAFDSYTRIIQGLRRFPHFRLVCRAHALRLEWSGPKQRVNAVTYVDRATGAARSAPAAAVVVAVGPLASSKLLLDSTCGDFPDGLGNNEGLLGRYLHDHADVYCLIEVDRPLPSLGQAAYLTRRSYDEAAPLLAASSTIGIARPSVWTRTVNLAPVPVHRFSVITFGTMVPTERNYVAPHPTLRDEFGLPLLDLHIRFDEEVQRNVDTARDRLLAILAAAGHPATVHDAIVRLPPGSSVHYGGTVRMHASPRHGVLDAWNRLHAVRNVAVVDASCFTTGVEKNPTLTVMALAARAADRLASDLKAS